MNEDNISLLDALKGQLEALATRNEAYKLQNSALVLNNESLQVQIGALKNQIEDLEGQLGALSGQLGALKGLNGALTIKLNEADEKKKVLTEEKKIRVYVYERLKDTKWVNRIMNSTFSQIISVLRFMLEKEIVRSDEIKSKFNIKRNTQWRYFRVIKPLGYFKLIRPNSIATFVLTEKGKQAKAEIQLL
jgi:hypothetical protein